MIGVGHKGITGEAHRRTRIRDTDCWKVQHDRRPKEERKNERTGSTGKGRREIRKWIKEERIKLEVPNSVSEGRKKRKRPIQEVPKTAHEVIKI